MSTGCYSIRGFVMALLAAALFSCNGNDANRTLPEAETPAGDTLSVSEKKPATLPLSGLFPWIKSNDPAFNPDSFPPFAAGPSIDPEPRPVNDAEHRLLQPYLLYNNDSTLAIDLYTNNYIISEKNGRLAIEDGDADYRVTLFDRARNNQWELSFFGPGTFLLDAGWADSHTVILAYAQLKRGTDTFRLFLEKIDTGSGTTSLTEYPAAIHARPEAYNRFPDKSIGQP